jgi:segregation and condensation protein A
LSETNPQGPAAADEPKLHEADGSGAAAAETLLETAEEFDDEAEALDDEAEPREPGPLDVQLTIYEGPLDLLLELVRKHKLNILDLPIAQITEQYLSYLKKAGELNIDLGGEFVFMAATLIHIKSKMLLPKDPTLTAEEEDDPRSELVQQLLDREKFVQAAHMLREKRFVEENVWSNPPVDAFVDDEHEAGIAVGVFDLVKTFETVVERFRNRPTFDVSEEEVSVVSRIEFLRNALLSNDRPLKLLEIFERQRSLKALVATFLAVLEMVRMQAILLRQDHAFGEIVIRKHKMFDAVFSADLPFASVDIEYGH